MCCGFDTTELLSYNACMSEKKSPDDTTRTTRREFVEGAAAVTAIGVAGCSPGTTPPPPAADKVPVPAQATSSVAQQAPAAASGPLRTLGKTGVRVQVVSLGGEGILRSTGRHRDAVPVIEEALRLGVRYCDTAPAYQQSQDYYGEALRNAGKGAREQIFLASKTHVRDRDGALRLLDDSLRRLGTDHLDLWQLHDLRSADDLDQIFGKGGAIEAVELAKQDGRVRYVGITGHHSASILVEAMRRYPVDNVLCAVNPSDPTHAPVLSSVVKEARARNVGVVGMKVMAAGQLLRDKAATPKELIRYAASHCDTVIIGCASVAEVRENFGVRHAFQRMAMTEMAALEERVQPRAKRYNTFKA